MFSRLRLWINKTGLWAIFFVIDSILLLNYFPKLNAHNLLDQLNLANVFDSKTFTQVIRKSEINSEPTYGGIAWGNYNNDGYLDLLLPDQAGKYHLYKNNHNETFTDVTEEAGLSSAPPANSAAFGDYNNDGCPDLYLATGNATRRTAPTDRLYHNNCNGTFSDVTISAGITNTSHGMGISWSDYNNDGLLDIYVTNFGYAYDRSESAIEPNVLYRNNGDGTFTDVAKQVGVTGLVKCKTVKPFPLFSKKDNRPQPIDKLRSGKLNWQPTWFDYNNDGFPDLYIANDDGISVLYKNNGNGTFTDTTEEAGLCHVGTGMGLAVGDYNGDGYLDLYVTHTFRNLLWRNNGNGTFTEVSEDAKVANFGFLGWGTEFFDYDNDGNLDLYAVNGSTGTTTKGSVNVKKQVKKKFDQLYRNNGDGTFTEVSEKEGLFGDDSKSTAAFGDYNNDGFIDVFIVSDDFPEQIDTSSNRLYRNTPNGNHWLTIQLVGTKSNRDAVGTSITLKTGNKSQMREVISGSSFLSQNSLWQTFGLGKNKIVDEIEIRWPSGIKQTLKSIKANQKIVVTEK